MSNRSDWNTAFAIILFTWFLTSDFKKLIRNIFKRNNKKENKNG